ncbi:MAG: DUF1013 domain-containing protein [Hyphomicrobiaceae bacterium]|nr:DUF1013 domain-containing protein [Hyphomicrobiaceae bacterium]
MSDSSYPLMPKATAVWLVDNTSLTFEQIASFCGMHILEIKGIADGDVGSNIRGKNPVTAGELTRASIKEAEQNPEKSIKLVSSRVRIPEPKSKKRPRYTPVSRRQDRPNAIVWLLRHHPDLKDSQIGRLVGTTKPTIQQVRDRSHWNSANLVPQDPVTLGLCKQVDLDMEVDKAVKQREKKQVDSGLSPMEMAGTLLPTIETTDYNVIGSTGHIEQQSFSNTEKLSADSVFGETVTSRPSSEEVVKLEEEARILARLQSMGRTKNTDDKAEDEEC